MGEWHKIKLIYGSMPKLKDLEKRFVTTTTQTAAPIKEKNTKNWLTILRIAQYMSFAKTKLIVVILLVVLSSAMAIATPFLLGYIVQSYLVDGEETGFISILLLLASLYIGQTLALWLQQYWMLDIAQRSVSAIRADVFNAVQKMKYDELSRHKNGDILSRLTNDLDNVSQTLSGTILQISGSILTFVGMLVLMMTLSIPLTLITLAVVPVMFLVIRWITRRTSFLFRTLQKETGTFSSYVDEHISGQLVIKTFNREPEIVDGFLDRNKKQTLASYWAQTFSGFIPKVFFLINNTSFALIATAGSVLAVFSLVTVGMIVTFVEYSRQFSRPLNDIASQVNTVFAAIAGAERAFKLLDTPVEETNNEQSLESISQLRGDIEFNDVNFSYNEHSPVLRQLSFSVSAGETVAIIGETGAGKSTVFQLLGRFYEASSGQIWIDGYDIQHIPTSFLRKQIAYVPQDPILFQTSIMENIRYARSEATDEEVKHAAYQARAHLFIEKLEHGYETIIEPSSGLSHGQKQQIAFARAFLSHASILALDEATSGIDTLTEMLLQEALVELMKGRTCLIIAHRLGTIRNADKIIVLHQGQLMEEGTHEQLLAKHGKYAKMIMSSEH